jgi:hypothetical protein
MDNTASPHPGFKSGWGEFSDIITQRQNALSGFRFSKQGRKLAENVTPDVETGGGSGRRRVADMDNPAILLNQKIIHRLAVRSDRLSANPGGSGF